MIVGNCILYLCFPLYGFLLKEMFKAFVSFQDIIAFLKSSCLCLFFYEPTRNTLPALVLFIYY